MGAISEFMSRDHDRLDAIFAKVRNELDAGKAKALFASFGAGLRAHIVWEEEILFPPFEERTGMRDAGPTAVMRLEHARILELLQEIGAAVGTPGAVEPAGALIEVLTPHNHKEENVLYPWLDQSLTPAEAAAILARIQGSPVGA